MKRYTREPDAWRVLTERDKEIVKAVFEARYLTNVEIGNLFFGGKVSSQCKTRLRFLYNLSMLDKRAGYINERDIYFLGEAGIAYIAKAHPSYSKWDVKKIAGVPATTKAPNIFMEHELTLSRLYMRARLEAAQLGYRLMWKNTAALKLEKLGFYPDGWLKVYNGHTSEAYLEFTADLTSVASKPELYDRHLPTAKVLWVTTSNDKLDKIGAAIAQSRTPSRFYLALLEDCRGFLSKSVWRVFDGEWQWRSFLG